MKAMEKLFKKTFVYKGKTYKKGTIEQMFLATKDIEYGFIWKKSRKPTEYEQNKRVMKIIKENGVDLSNLNMEDFEKISKKMFGL